MKPKPPMTQENIQQVESPIDEDKNQQNYKKHNVTDTDINIMLNDNVFTQGSADVKQKEKTDQETPDSVKKKFM